MKIRIKTEFWDDAALKVEKIIIFYQVVITGYTMAMYHSTIAVLMGLVLTTFNIMMVWSYKKWLKETGQVAK